MLALSEQISGLLATRLKERSTHLHHSIRVSDRNSCAALASFIARYVALAPDFVAAFETFLSAADIDGVMAQQIATAREFLDTPIRSTSSEQQLEAEMYQAYLAHRVMDELNDVLKASYGCPIMPLDMFRSNLIIHHIIGEPFANHLDQVIELLSGKLISALPNEPSIGFKIKSYLAGSRTGPATRLPCLTESSSIRLVMNDLNSQIRLL